MHTEKVHCNAVYCSIRNISDSMLFSDTKAKRALGSSTGGSPVRSRATRHCLQTPSQGFCGCSVVAMATWQIARLDARLRVDGKGDVRQRRQSMSTKRWLFRL